MANYNHEILVNYLRDVYSMELLVHKIQADICSARKDIQREQAVVPRVILYLPENGNTADCGK